VGSALAVALPASLLAQVIDTADGRDDPPAVVYLLVAVVLAAMGVGGWVVGRRRPARPAPLGATVGLAAIAVIQVLGVVRRLVAGDDVAWATIPLTVALAMAVGAGAAVLGARQPGRTRR
jgi:putative membrane protein (TIGR04086 family)